MKNLKIAAAAFGAAATLAATLGSVSAETAQEQRNKQIATDFYNAGFNEKNWDKAVTYMGPRYTQHSIYMGDGPDPLKALVEKIKTQFPLNRGDIKRSFADGDIVVLQVHVTRKPGALGWSVFEMMRVEKGKVVEHWDNIQSVPATSANNNTMF